MAVDKYAVFEKWMLDNGAKFEKLELKDHGDDYRSCQSLREIDDNEIVIEVPLKCLITVEMGKETTVGRAVIDANLDLDAPKHIFLMLFLLLDMKNPSSFFKPYYDILPLQLNNMPIFWQPHELQYLQGSYMLEQIEERKIAIEADYRAICSIVPSFQQIVNLEEFKWARMCVCSRNFGLLVNGLQTAALVPYADMLNHYRPRETKWQFDEALQSFTVVSLQPISSHCEVFDSYGRKCNHRFLLNYGFSVENNIESDGSCPNEVPILIEFSKNDPLYELKCSYYRRDVTSFSRRLRVAIGDCDNNKVMFALLRLIIADQEDLELLVSCVGPTTYRSIRDAQIAISPSNEFRMLQQLIRVCDIHLAAYANTYEHDIDRLKNGQVPAFSNERNALIQVKGEKEILVYFKDFALTALKLISAKSTEEFDELLNFVRTNKHTSIFQYCRNTASRLFQENIRRGALRSKKQYDLTRPTVV